LDRSRAYLAAWICFKSDAPSALGDGKDAVRLTLSKQLPEVLAAEQRPQRAAEHERAAAEQEDAAEDWARRVVRTTGDALQVRRACESIGAVMWRAGADIDVPLWDLSPTIEDDCQGLLATSTAVARAEEYDEHVDEVVFATEFEHDDIVGYVDDYRAARASRRTAHGAPRRLCEQKAWVAGHKVRARAPAHARKQKQALVADARSSIADARRVRMLRRARVRAAAFM